MLTLIATVATRAQIITWEDFADEFFDENDDEENPTTTLYDELLEMHHHPVNINEASREDLLHIPFLNEAQADSILSLVARSGGLMSLGELMFVRNLEYKERKYLPLFIFCPDDGIRNKTPRPDSLQHRHLATRRDYTGRRLVNEISSTFGLPLYKREGFKDQLASVLAKNPNKQYLGTNQSHTFRYRASLDNKNHWGLTMQKDEGEPFASRGNRLYDSYSFYLAGRGSNILRQWIVGDYRAHFGLGLTIGSSAGEALSILSSNSAHQSGFTRHTATDEYSFLRGGAVSLVIGKLTVHTFASWRKMDATLKNDSISTILTNGYHRTQLEMSKRHNIQALQGGASATYDFSALKLGINIVHTHYDTPYITPTALYRKHYFEGQDFGNYSLSYTYHKNKFHLWGEAATSLQGGIATQHRVHYTFSSRLKFTALHRYYSTHYLSPTAQSYKVGSLVQNEHGIMLGLLMPLSEFWTIKTYLDYAHHPFAVYATSHASSALTAHFQAEYAPSSSTTLLLRYKYRQRPKDNKLKQLDCTRQHTLKTQLRYTLGPLNMATAADLTLLSQPDKDNTMGWMLSQRAMLNLSATAARASRMATSLNFDVALFHTDSYSEALRLYESSLPYSTGYPACYYHGQRLALSVVQKIGIVQLALKYALTHYTNRDNIGTGLRLYEGSTLQDLALQGIIRF